MTPPTATHPAKAQSPEARRALLAARLRQRAAAEAFEHPMSLGQQALWFLHRGAPESSAYTMAFATRFHGAVDRTALRRALEKLLHRHASLRTTFPMQEGQPVARVASWQALAWEELACVGLSAESGGLDETLEAVVARPFDLEAGPLFRATLVRGPDEDSIILLTVHHIVADGWSLAILLDELGRLYTAESRGIPADLPAVGTSFDAFVRWQDEATAGTAGEEAWRYWRHHLSGPGEARTGSDLPTLDLPADHVRPRMRAMVGGAVPIDLDPTAAARLGALAREQGMTLFALLLAAFQAFLHRWSGQPSVLVGTPAAARDDSRWQSLVGYCTNPIVLRGDFGDDPSFADFAHRTADAIRQGLEHQAFPFPLLVQRLLPQRDLARSPVFQAFFVYKREGELGGRDAGRAADAGQAGTGQTAGWGALRTERQPVPQLSGQFEVTFDAVVSPEGIDGTLLYDRELFLPATAARMADAFATFLASIAAAPDRRVSVLRLAAADHLVWPEAAPDPAASERVPSEPGGAAADSSQVIPVDGRLASWARETPESPALHPMLRGQGADAAAGTGLTYAELEFRVSRLAAVLRQRGIVEGNCDRESVVGVAIERSPTLVVALLAILRAGGTYLAIDPSFPVERVRWMLDDSGTGHVLVDAAGQAAVPATYRERAIEVDWLVSEAVANGVGLGTDPGLAARARPATAAAYVLYTSGSTGRPKGVVVSHGALDGFLTAMQAHLGLSPRDRWLAITTISFDIAGLELFLPLVTGGELVVAQDAHSQDGERLGQLLAARAITVLQATPATWRLLLASGWRGQDRLRMLCGGEAMPVDLARALAERTSGEGAGVWNLYGPTEATIWSTVHRICQADGACFESPSVSIGQPLNNTVLAIVDHSLRALPPGAFGELAIGGTGVARGYRGQPSRTAERFVPDPFSGRPGARLYCTGDRVHQRPNGDLAFHGRGDQQVKLRGFRIELGEIEAALRAHPAVDDAAVVMVPAVSSTLSSGKRSGDSRAEDRQLVACWTATAAGAQDNERGTERADALTAAFREHLAARLPRYMIPARFVALDGLPRTPNGKLDRNALEDLPAMAIARGNVHRPPATDTEKRLASIWQAVLAVEAVGADDDFFADVGGHSLLAAQILTRVRNELGVDLDLRVLFEEPTVARLAGRIDREIAAPAPADQEDLAVGSDGEGGPALVPLPRDPGAGEAALPISFAQERLWFLEQYEPESAFYAMPVALRFVGDLELDALRRALDHLVDRHETLRTEFHTVDGRPTLRIAASARVALPIDDLAAEGSMGPDGEDPLTRVHARLRAEVARPFDLSQAPLLRARLLRLGAQDHVLVVTTHHIASDGWSTQIMVREVAARYRMTASALPPLPVQYVDYAAWQRRLLTGPRLAQDVAYWRKQLAGVPALELPTDHPRPAEQGFHGRTLRFQVPQHVCDALDAVGRELGATRFMTLLAAFQALLGRLSGQQDFCIGTPVANRPRVALEGLIGFFVNMLPLRADLSDDPSFRHLVARSRDVVLAAHGRQHLPFERLVDELDLPRDLSRSPLFQAVLILHPRPRQPVALPGLDVSPMALDTGTAKFDLTLALTEDDDGLRGELEIASALFDEATSRRIVAQLQRLLIAAAIRPDMPISRLSLLAADERAQLLERWNETERPVPDRAVHRQIAAQAARAPERIALCFGEHQLTYGELGPRVEDLATALRAEGVGPDVVVGICLERSMAMVIAVLAVLEAGGTYLPLDPAYPAERLRLLVEDAKPECLVATEAMAARLPRVGAVVVPDDPTAVSDDSAAARSTAGRGAQPRPEQAAYILHTSGSTGRPKGVVVPHAALTNFLATMAERPGLGPDDTFLAVTSLSFDISALELLLPLTVGARLVIASRDQVGDGHALRTLIDGHQVTAMQATPATWRLLLATGWTGRRGLAVLCGGEALPRQLANDLAERADSVWNLYGPTETTVWSAVHRLPPATTETPSDPVAIGRPIANTRLYVLDDALEPVPVGVPGELYIGGSGVTRGYHGRPATTAERFVPDPYRRGMRLYRTGDRVRYRPDGSLLFIDRLDRQVKVRGFRVELGEVEIAVRAHPAVAESAVVCLDDASGGQQLVACLRLEADGGSLSAEQESALQGEQVTAWRSLWSEAYRGTATSPELDTSGWLSSFTGQPIPADAMRAWRDERVARILALGIEASGMAPEGRPRIWEIGCGTGLLTRRLAPSAGRYLATDVSPAAIARLEHNLAGPGQEAGVAAWQGLSLAARPADDFTGIEPASFDTVIINSVVQYFPDFAYFERVLAGALEAVRPGGALFLGDLRSFPLLEAFHLAVLDAAEGREGGLDGARADQATTAGTLRQQLETALANEEELLIDPAYFTALASRWAGVGGCEVLVQRAGDREMSHFRYDVVVYRSSAPDGPVARSVTPRSIGTTVDWPAIGDVDALRARLEGLSASLEVRDVPNRRVTGELARLHALRAEPDDAAPVAESVAAVASSGVDPAVLWELGEAVGCRVRVRWSARTASAVDVLFEPQVQMGLGQRGPRPSWPLWSAREAQGVRATRSGSRWANQPLQASRERRLLPAIRAFVGERLPGHAVPSTWMRLDRLPLTPNGKVDRKTLARRARQASGGPGAGSVPGRRAPATPLEQQVAAIWCDVLRRDFVSLDDNFFEIGGHSLLAAHAHGRLREAGFALDVIDLFRHPSLAALVAFLDAGTAPAATAPVATEPIAAEGTATEARVTVPAEAPGATSSDAAANRARQRLDRRAAMANRRRGREPVRQGGKPARTPDREDEP